MSVGLYSSAGLDIYEQVHYARGEHVAEVGEILSWYRDRGTRVLDLGCGGGLHALEFTRRGFSVTGIDVEPSAIALAKRRGESRRYRIRFEVADLRTDALSPLGRFDLVYSLGNVLSHVAKPVMAGVVRRIHECLAAGGTFLFDVLVKGRPFRRDIRDEKLRIHWLRALEERTGRVWMDGYFLDYGLVQPFEVWAYAEDEVDEILEKSGFSPADVSGRLDFTAGPGRDANPFCLNFRARRKEDA